MSAYPTTFTSGAGSKRSRPVVSLKDYVISALQAAVEADEKKPPKKR
jgi:hypothetical protein